MSYALKPNRYTPGNLVAAVIVVTLLSLFVLRFFVGCDYPSNAPEVAAVSAETCDVSLPGGPCVFPDPPPAHYIDEQYLPRDFDENKHGDVFPFIVVDGVEFHHWANWYHFAGTNARTLIKGTPPDLTYSIPHRRVGERGEVQQRFSTAAWAWIGDDLTQAGATLCGATESRMRDMPKFTGSPVYIDEKYLPQLGSANGKSGTQRLGEALPHIVIDGVRLDYDPTDKYFHFQGVDAPRAMWMGFGGDMMLGTSERTKNGESLLEITREVEMERWNPKTQAWEPAPPQGPPAVPPRPAHDATEIIMRTDGSIVDTPPLGYGDGYGDLTRDSEGNVILPK